MAVFVVEDGHDPELRGKIGADERGVSIWAGGVFHHEVFVLARFVSPPSEQLKHVIKGFCPSARWVIQHPTPAQENYQVLDLTRAFPAKLTKKEFPTYDAAAMYIHMLCQII